MNGPDERELSLIKEYLILQLVKAVFERDAGIINQSEIKTKGPYIDILVAAFKRAHEDFMKVQTEISRIGIVIEGSKQLIRKIKINYNCRGNEETLEYGTGYLQYLVEAKMRFYLNNKGRE